MGYAFTGAIGYLLPARLEGYYFTNLVTSCIGLNVVGHPGVDWLAHCSR